MKKPLIFLLVLMLLCQTSFAAGIGIYPLGNGKVEIAGEKNPSAETTVMLFDGSTGEIIGITQVGAGEGEFSEVLNITESPDGANYVIRVNGEDKTVKNVAPAGAVAELQAAPLNEVEEVLVKYSRIFDIDIAPLEELQDKSYVLETMEAETFTDESDVKTKYEAALEGAVEVAIEEALQMIADGEAEEAIDTYNAFFDIDVEAYEDLLSKSLVYGKLNGNTYTKEAMEAAFAEYLLIAQIVEASGEDFAYLITNNEGEIGITASEFNETVFAKVDAVSDFESLAAIGEKFLEERALYKVNTATKETIKGILEDNNDILGILDVEGYDNLSNELQEKACKALVKEGDNDYESVSVLYSEFEALVKRVKNNQGGQQIIVGGDSDRESGTTVGFGGGTTSQTTPLTPSETSDMPFTDLTKSHWGYSSIYALYKKGIISGTSETTVEPDRYVTREEFIKMLVVTFGIYDENAENVFSDIPAGDWSEKYVASAYAAGITNGNGEGTFGKGQHITRQDMVVMATRCAEAAGYKFEGEAEVFKDEEKFAEYAKESIYKMAGAKIVNGVGKGNFSPVENCTRAMAAKVCNELIKMGGAAK